MRVSIPTYKYVVINTIKGNDCKEMCNIILPLTNNMHKWIKENQTNTIFNIEGIKFTRHNITILGDTSKFENKVDNKLSASLQLDDNGMWIPSGYNASDSSCTATELLNAADKFVPMITQSYNVTKVFNYLNGIIGNPNKAIVIKISKEDYFQCKKENDKVKTI